MVFFFFFQAEDGIRDGTVTGVQTCALPISTRRIDIPEKLMGPRFIQFTCTFPAAKIALSGHMPLIHTRGGPQSSRWICQIDNRRSLGQCEPAHAKLWIVYSEGASFMVREADPQR